MKKRILSMLLAVITVVAMIPAALVTAFADATTYGYEDGYSIFVSDIEPTVDGVLDEVYKKSEAVVPNDYSGTSTSDIFKTYAVITNKGIYFCTTVKDSTLGKKETDSHSVGDKVQIYLQISNADANGVEKWAYDYIEMDYVNVNKVDDNTTVPSVKVPYDLKNATKNFARTKTDTGYTVEVLIEWENCASVFNGATITPETVKVYFGVQVNDCDNNGNRTGLAYDNSSASSYWVKTSDVGSNGQKYVKDENGNYVKDENGKNVITGEITRAYNSVGGAQPLCLMIPTNLFKSTIGHYYGYDVYISDTDPIYTDGTKDAVYSKSEKIVQTHYADTNKTSVSYEAYAVVTANGLFVFADVKDTTVDDTSATVNWADKLQLFLQVANTNAAGVKEWAFGYFEMDYAHTGSNKANRSDNFSSANNYVYSTTTANDGYTIEFYMPWEGCATIFNGDTITPETMELYFGIQVNNSQEKKGDGNTELGVAYDVPECANYWHRTTATDKNGNLINYTTNYDAPSGREPQNKMVKASLFTESDIGYTDGYDTVVASPAQITFDGNRDDIYLQSEKIVPNHYNTKNGLRLTDIDFAVYPVVTEEGIYIWAEVEDHSTNVFQESSNILKNNDKLQINFQIFGDKAETISSNTYRWGYIEFDYAHNSVSGSQYFSSSYPNCTPDLKTNITAYGWTAEFFMSWDEAWNETGINTNDLNEISVYIGVQANNSDAGAEPNYGQAYNTPEAQNYWSGDLYSLTNVGNRRYIKLNYVYTGNQPLDSGVANIPSFSVYETDKTLTVDGIRDNIYLNSQKISEKAVVGSGTGFDAYFVATDDGIYLFAEVDDSTAGKDADDKIRIYLTDDPSTYAQSTYNTTPEVAYQVTDNYDVTINVTSKTQIINNIFATQTPTYLDITANGAISGTGFVANSFNGDKVLAETKKLTDASGKAYAWTAEAFIPWSSMENYQDEIDVNSIFASKLEKSLSQKITFTNSEGEQETKTVSITEAQHKEAYDKIKNYVTQEVNAVKTSGAPYKCAVGISVHNGSNVSYSNERRYDWYEAGTEAGKAYNYVTSYLTDGRSNDNSESYIVDAYYVPLTYTARIPEVRNVYVTETEKNEIKLDGIADDVYKNSSKLYKKDTHGDGSKIEFTSYSVATLDGLYVWVITNDSTLDKVEDYDAGTGDRIQIYYDWTLNYRSHDVNGYLGSNYHKDYTHIRAGWVCVDYEENLSTRSLGEKVDLSGVKYRVVKIGDDNWNAANALTKYSSGYAVEVFIPWDDEMRDQIGEKANDIHMGLGIQVSNDENEKTTEDNGIAYCASQMVGGKFKGYYDNYDLIPDVNLIYEPELPEYSRFVIDEVATPVVIDGSNTDGEYDNAIIIRADKDGRGEVDDGDVIRIVYNKAEKAIYMLVEVEDNTPSYEYDKFGIYADYVDLAIVFDNKYTTMTTFYRSENGVDLINDNSFGTDGNLRVDYAGHPVVSAAGLRWWNYDSSLNQFIDKDKSVEQQKTVYDSNYIACTNDPYRWSYEIKIPLGEDDIAKIDAGTFVFGVAAQYLDSYDTDGNGDDERNYKYTVKNSGVYMGDNAMNGSYFVNTAAAPSELHKFSYFKFANVDESTVEGARGVLGEAITVNFYVNAPEGADSVVAKIIMNNRIEFVEGVPAPNTCGENYMRQYVISFSGIAPQCVGDNIKAMFYVDGKQIKTATTGAEEINYSVLQYCENIYGNYGEQTNHLVEALLDYCAAAQEYVNYKTDNLVNQKYKLAADIKNTYGTPTQDDKYVSGYDAKKGVKFSALGVYHYSTNKIYTKFTIDTSVVTNPDDIKVKVNGKEATKELYSKSGNVYTYIVYSDSIKVTGFDRPYTFELYDENGTIQTVKYSINAYSAVKWNSSGTVGDLARAMYYYGMAAEAYKNA